MACAGRGVCRVIQAHPVAAGVLGRVEGGVRGREEPPPGAPLKRVPYAATTDGTRDRRVPTRRGEGTDARRDLGLNPARKLPIPG